MLSSLCLPTTPTAPLLRILALAACFALSLACPEQGRAAAADSRPANLLPVWGETPFPPRDVRVLSNHATSGVLVLRFENLNPYTAPKATALTTNFLIAGASARTPVVTVKNARYRRIRGSETAEILDTIPPASHGETARAIAARMLDGGVLRHLSVYTLALNTVLPVVNIGGSVEDRWVMDFLELEIDLGAPPALAPAERALAESFRSSSPQKEPGFVEAQVLNADIDAAYFQMTPQRAPEAVEKWAGVLQNAVKDGPVYRVRVYEPGLYSLTAEALQNADGATPAPDAQPGSTQDWRLYRRGSEVPLLLDDSDSKSPRALFHVAPIDVAGGEDVLWLVPRALSGTAGEAAVTSAPRRMEVLNPSGSGAFADGTTSTLAKFETIVSRPEDYNPRLRPSANASRWYWKSVGAQEYAALDLTLPEGFDPKASGAVDLTIVYAFAGPFHAGPALELVVNGAEDLSTSLTAAQGMTSLRIPSGLLHPGVNRIAARLKYAAARGDQPDALIQKLTATWNQPLDEPGLTTMPFHVDSVATGPLVVAFGKNSDAVTSPGALLFVSKGNNIYALKRSGATEGGSGAVRFTDPRPGRATYLLAEPQTVSPPGSIEVVTAVLDPEKIGPADYLIVAPGEFHRALEPLVKRREQDGHRVALVDPISVFDRYGFGLRDPEAIKSLLAHAFYFWPAPKLHYVLLAGEASDYRGDPDALPGGGQLDLVPVFNTGRGDSNHGDHPYSTITGSDALVDLAVGRLSVGSAGELERVVAKILAYEDAPVSGEDWLERTDYIYDDNEEFPRAVSSVIAGGQAPPGRPEHLRQTDYPYVPNMRVTGRKRSHEATDELLRRFREGMSVINFFGHGGPNLWSHERMLHLSDVPGLSNAPRLPFVTCASCDNAWLDYPMRPVNTSIGELLVKLPQGGAIGVFGPVSGASPYEHQTLVGRLMEGLYRQQIRRMGDLTAYAKNMYYTDSRSSSLPDQYILLGDPALRVRVPVLDPGMELRPDSVTAGRAWSGKIQLTDAGADVTTAVYSIRSLETGEEIISGPLRLAGDRGGRSSRIIGPSLKPGSYSVSVKAGGTGAKVYAQRLKVMPAAEDGSGLRSQEGSAPVAGQSGISVVPLQPFAGDFPPSSAEPPQFAFQILSDGTSATTSLTARVLAEGDELVAESTTVGDLASGAQRVISLPSRRAFPEGRSSVTLQLTSAATSGVLFQERFSFDVVAPPQLEFVPGSARVESAGDRVTAHETVYLKALLRNSGAKTAQHVQVRARIGDPVSGGDAVSINDSPIVMVGEIRPGETVPVTFRWENAEQSGEERRIFLILDGVHRAAAGSAPLSIEVPAVRVGPAPNYTLSEFQAGPAYPGLGTTVTLSAVISERNMASRGPVEVELGLRDEISGESSAEKRIVADLSRPTSVSAELFVDRPYSLAYAAVNPAKEYYESNVEDNRQETRLRVIVPVRPGPDGLTHDLPIEGGMTTNTLLIPGQGLRLVETFNSAPTDKITSSQIASGRFIPSRGGGDRAFDRQWSVIDGLAETFDSEDAGALGIRVAAEADTTSHPLYDVYIRATSSPDRTNASDGSFEVSVEDETVFRPVQFRVNAGEAFTDVPLGRYDLRDGALDAMIRVTSSTLFLSGVQLEPVAGFMRSPVYDLGTESEGRAGRLVIDSSRVTPADAVCSYRSGSRKSAADEIVWSPWEESKGLEGTVSATGRFFQWRCMVTPGTSERSALISGAKLILE